MGAKRIRRDNIANYLDFKEHPHSKRKSFDNEQIAELPSGSYIFRKQQYNKGLFFQLFLNDEEYLKIKESDIEGLDNLARVHFYGGNYIYLPPGSHLIIPIAKYMGWNNPNYESELKPRKFRFTYE